MIKFFRKIRQKLLSENKFSKYVIYGVGEIILVVIGILIALQVNNNNNENKKHLDEISMLEDLKVDLEMADQKVKVQIELFKNSQDIHYQIYNESIGKASYDSTLRYHDIVWHAPMRNFIGENYASRIGEISDERLMRILRDYLWREELALEAIEEWNDVKLNKVRPFLDKNGLYDNQVAFNDEPYEFMTMGKDGIVINYAKFSALYGTQELDQLLYYLRHSASWALHCMGKLEDANTNVILALDYYINGELIKLDSIKPLKGYY